jgi:protein SHQ1
LHHRLILPSTLIRADFADNEQIEELLAWTHPHLESSSAAPSPNAIIFTEAENLAMLRLPRKECKYTITFHFVDGNNNSKHFHIIDLASPQETHNLYLTLLTLLFAYAYDARTTQHDPTPESAWTIATLTTAFSALDPPPYSHSPHPSPQVIQKIKVTDKDSKHSDFDFESAELAETFIPSYRRAIAFPLYRSWALADACRKDVAHFLLRGMRTVLRCLLELRAILDAHEAYYVYSRIWLDDFCRWIQACARCIVFTTWLYYYYDFDF